MYTVQPHRSFVPESDFDLLHSASWDPIKFLFSIACRKMPCCYGAQDLKAKPVRAAATHVTLT